MERFVVLLVFFAVLSFLETGSALQSFKHNKMMNRGAADEDCFDVYAKCRNNTRCKTALRTLNKNCKIRNGQCESDTHLELCRDIKNELLTYGFPEKRCQCSRKFARCFSLLNKVYANPCIEDQRRRNNIQKAMPTSSVGSVQNITPGDIETSNKVTPSGMGILPSTDPSRDQDPVGEDETIFGDEGFAKPPPTNDQPHTSQRSNLTHRHEMGMQDQDAAQTEVMTTTFLNLDSAPVDTADQTTSFDLDRLELLRLKLNEEESEITKDMRLRIGSIVIGSIFVLAILLGAAVLGCRRMRKTRMFYKKGNVAQQRAQDLS